MLADRIEDMLNGTNKLFLNYEKPNIENYATFFYKKIVEQKLHDVKVNKSENEQHHIIDYQDIDLNSLITEQAKEIGSEWLVYQAVKQLEIDKMLKNQGFDEKEMKTAVAHIISRCVFPASENKTAQWINENSGLLELPGLENLKITYIKSVKSEGDETFLYIKSENKAKKKKTQWSIKLKNALNRVWKKLNLH